MTKRVTLDEKTNPKYYSLFNEANELIKSLEPIVTDLREFKYPRFFIRCAKHKLSELGKSMLDFEKKFVSWRNETINFCLKPNYVFHQDDQQDVAYLHFTTALRDAVGRVQDYVNLASWQSVVVASNLRAIRDNTKYLISLFIAIMGLVAGIVLPLLLK